MKLYLLEQRIVGGYDTFDSMVVAADNEQEAREIHPHDDWRETHWPVWVSFNDIDKVEVTYLGDATHGLENGVVCASFNAG